MPLYDRRAYFAGLIFVVRLKSQNLDPLKILYIIILKLSSVAIKIEVLKA
jgi:hypothetical protein